MIDHAAASLQITQERHFPLVVVGGGLAGMCAAVAAARHGISVALVQERPVLGGNSSSEIRVHPVGASQHGYHRDARETGLMEEIFLEARARSYGLRQINGQHYPLWDVILSEMAEAEPILSLFLNTRVVGVETGATTGDGYDTRIDALLAVQMSTEQTFRLRCDYVIDATGDGVVALQTGAPCRYGREARAEFDEPRAPVEADTLVLGSTIMFAARDVGRPVPFVPPAWAHDFPTEESLPFRTHDRFDSGYWWIEWGGRLHTVTDNEAIRRELHAAVFGVWDHIKNHCTAPGIRERAATWTLDWIGHLPGKRESRRFEGDVILTEHDILRGLGGVPADVVAHGGWPIDLHPPDGIYSPAVPAANPPLPGLYGIPLRALYSRTCANLFLAGRDISVSHVAHGSTRVMKTCAVIGQASGTAAAVAIRRACTPRALASDPRAVHALQQTLLRDGVYLPFVCNDDPRDLTRQPGVRAAASSEATLRLDEDDLANPAGWERAGESAAETPARLPAEVPLARPLAQALVLSEGHLDALRLDVHSSAPADVPVHIYVRQGDHLRDIGPAGASARDIAVLDAIVPPGSTTITVAPPRPLTVDRRCPVIIVLDTAPAVSWRLSSQEPPGTQAAVWDEDLGYWRWLHGTLRVAATPDSVPYGACNVLSGVTRPERGPNLWVSDPAQPLPQQVEVAWPGPVRIGSVEVTFDSQLSGWIWEGAFPLLARDYTVDVREACDGRWVEVAHVSGNHQRRRVHTFAPREARAVRVTVLATNGGRTARIVEVRAYTPTGGDL